MKNDHSKFFLSSLFGFVVFLLLFGAQAQAQKEGILIFRPLNNASMETEKQVINFEVEASAFSKITALKVNGKPRRIQPGSWVQVKVPYRLKYGRNVIVVDVSTEFETATKEFVIRLKRPGKREEEEKEKKALSFVGVIGQSSIDNPLKANHMQHPWEPGKKTFLVLLPKYDWRLSRKNSLVFEAIFAREKYDREELDDTAIAFSQWKTAYAHNFSNNEFWRAGLGINAAFQGFNSWVRGKRKQEQDTLLFADTQLGFGKTGLYAFGLEHKLMTFRDIPPDIERDETGSATTLNGKVESDLWVVRGKLSGGYGVNSPAGSLKEKTTTTLGAEVSYPIWQLILTTGRRYKKTSFTNPDPVTLNLAPENRATSNVFNVLYSITDYLVGTMEYVKERNDSNYFGNLYSTKTVTGSLIYIF